MTALQSLGPLRSPTGSSLPLLTLPTPSASAFPPTIQTLFWSLQSAAHCPQLTTVHATSPISVRTYTSLLTQHIHLARLSHYRQFVSLAQPGHGISEAATRFQSALRLAWRLPVENILKQTLWRMAINSIPGCKIHPWHCRCCVEPQHNSRIHTFWDCPIACAVRTQIDIALGSPCTRPCLWLLRLPNPTISPSVWSLVCLAALDAMDFGRRQMWARHHDDLAIDILGIGHHASLRFWASLQDFVFSHPISPFPLPADHPFLCIRAGRLELALPQLPPAAPPPPLSSGATLPCSSALIEAAYRTLAHFRAA